MKPSLTLIGPGRVGCALGRLLFQAGYPINTIFARDREKAAEAASFIGCPVQIATSKLKKIANADILLMTLPDDQLAEFSARLCTEVELQTGTTLIHCSGLHPANILKRPDSSYGRLSIHPLLPFADRALALNNLKDCPCAVEGDASHIPLGLELVEAFGGKPFTLPAEAKHLYHTAAAIASNFMVSLTATARDLLCDCGFNQEEALRLLAPIHQATSRNILELGPERALTGPIARGDAGTVAIHLEALRNQPAELGELYRCLGKATLRLAERSGRLPDEKALSLSKLLQKK